MIVETVMAKNRKKSETYRFNGVWGVTPVRADELREWITKFEAKLADPDDPDDQKWTRRWLARFKKELAKKEESRQRRQQEVSKKCRKLPEPLLTVVTDPGNAAATKARLTQGES
jgi:thiamine pyrophosphate-dependent acetolactate synthase large subunit-like protein